MADDQPAAKRVRIAAGSKDEEARQPLSSIQGLSPAVQAGIKAGNINFSDGKPSCDFILFGTVLPGGSYDLSTVSEQRQQEVLAEFEKRKKVNRPPSSLPGEFFRLGSCDCRSDRRYAN